MSLLSIENLKTHFFTKAGLVKSVDGVSFELDRGEILGIVGESGSGKSVTGFSIMGLVDPPGRVVEGSIRFDGQDLVGMAEPIMRDLQGRRIAMIFQDPMMTLNPVLRVDTQMIEALRAHGPWSDEDARQRCRDVLGQGRNSQPRRAPQKLSAPILRRDAPARCHRNCAVAPAGPDHCGRAHDGS